MYMHVHVHTTCTCNFLHFVVHVQLTKDSLPFLLKFRFYDFLCTYAVSLSREVNKHWDIQAFLL